MTHLTAEDFGAYFEEAHGYKPFRWQERLLKRVARERRWPGLVDLPTGAGKTAALDVAVFHLALEASRGGREIEAPRRIVMVVDRRTVVDQAFERAKKIAEKLAGAKDGVLYTVAERLRSLGGDRAPLAVAQLRGGMPRDDSWAERPDQPLIAVSTVDQVGSRLLFRGYGVSDGMRPVHAGLLGNDVLLLLDEVHLSEPFRRTLESVERYRRWPRSGGAALPDRWQFVQMSATPGGESDFHLEEEDRGDERLARRLQAKKPVETHEVKVSGGPAAKRATFAAECAARAVGLAKAGRCVGVVVNRVATARDIAARLRGDSHLPPGAQVFLVTGRMRPIDRDDLDGELARLVQSGRDRKAEAGPLIVVATQCIEAGADFDFDALVTECASLDALRQRFGRLNRMGEIEDARGVVLIPSGALAKDASDPIYGDALARTWQWLGREARDLGISAIQPAIEALRDERGKGEDGQESAIEALLAPRARAPVMLPAHLDTWVQTKPAPFPDPDVALWLHGIGRQATPEVQIVWRADVSEQAIRRATEKKGKPVEEALLTRLEACPPVGLEALSVPIAAARAWLQGEDAPDLADVEGEPEKEEERTGRAKQKGRPALLWKGDESKAIWPEDLRPEQTIIVPCAYGGLAVDRFPGRAPRGGTWDPSSKEAVPDIGDRARWQQTRRPTLRLHPGNVDRAEWARAPAAPDSDDPGLEDREAADEVLDAMRGAVEERSWQYEVVKSLSRKGKSRPPLLRLDPLAWEDENGKPRTEPGYLALIGRFREGAGRGGESRGDATTEGDNGSHTGVEVTLRDHLDGVRSWARRFAERCGLSGSLARSVELAGLWHDAGKVDERFQRMLRGGGDAGALIGEPLAKSKTVLADRAARRRARERSGYPEYGRHELASVALLARNTEILGTEVDVELVLHLIASHHGHCRPFAPVVDDASPVPLRFSDESGAALEARSDHGLERLDSGVADRFWTLVDRYGWFGLAWLEAIVRLADHRRSEEEQQKESSATDPATRRDEHE